MNAGSPPLECLPIVCRGAREGKAERRVLEQQHYATCHYRSAYKVLCTREEEEMPLLSGSREGTTEKVTLEWHVRRFRSHQVNEEGKGIPSWWNSMCKGTEAQTWRFQESARS